MQVIPGVEVSLKNGGTAKSNNQGIFEFDQVPEGTATLFFLSEPRKVSLISLTFAEGYYPINISLTVDHDFLPGITVSWAIY